jgi:hypothetical protein
MAYLNMTQRNAGGVHFLVAIEADELFIDRNFDLFVVALAQDAMTGLEPIFVGIGHRDQFDRAILGAQRIGRRPRAAATAADERDLHHVRFIGIRAGE